MVERLQGLLGNFGSSLNNMSLPASLGLLSSGVSILEGNPIGQSINTGLQTFGGLTQIDQQRRQREGIEALKKQYANNPKILSLIDANPTAALNAITTRALTPVETFEIVPQNELPDVLKNKGVFQRSKTTGKITQVGGQTDPLLAALMANNTTATGQTPSAGTEAMMINGKKVKARKLEGDFEILILEDNSVVKRPIPGTKTAQLEEQRENQATLKFDQVLEKRNLLTSKIDEAISLIKNQTLTSPVTGLTGTTASNITGTNAYNLNSILETIKGNIGFSELISLKEQGGSLGAISEAELRGLQQASGNIDQGLDKDVLTKNLNDLKARINRQVNSASKIFFKQYPQFKERYGDTSIPQPTFVEIDAANISLEDLRKKIGDNLDFNRLTDEDLLTIMGRIQSGDLKDE